MATIGDTPQGEGLTALQKQMLSIAAESDHSRKTASILSVMGPRERIIKVCRQEVADKDGSG